MSTTSKEQAHVVVDDLFAKYADDPYMLPKVQNYICNQLHGIFNNMHRLHGERVARIEDLTNERDNFIQSFLHNNQYFYVSSTDSYFYYDGSQYQLYNEDDILHHVLSSISRDRHLMSWKQRTKINIMKRIKENNITSTIPESETIQMVIDALCPTIFASRMEAKYFLTVIGDNIFKKNTGHIHFIDPVAKNFLRNLNNISQMLFGNSLLQTFKYKYHDHSYQDCRLVRINDIVRNESTWNVALSKCGLDILCVACHYSSRYKNADEFAMNLISDQEIIDHIFFVKNMNTDDLIRSFIHTYIDIEQGTSDPTVSQVGVIALDGHPSQIRATQITWKNMQYLWKHYLDEMHVPPMIFLNTLKGLLIERLGRYYNSELDTFTGVCSKYLPAIQVFLQFWNNTMTIDETETDLEIGEILVLFRRWCEMNNESIVSLNDKHMLDIIAYYYPTTEIERDKYISHIRCSLWDKQMDIQIAMDNMKETIRSRYTMSDINRSVSPGLYRNVSIYDAYLFYCKSASTNIGEDRIEPTSVGKQVVSKSYFEKYIYDNYSDYIVESKFLTPEWYQL